MSAIALPASSEGTIPAVPHPLWRLSVERYHHMIQAGFLTEDDSVELLEGLLVAKMNKSPRHCAAGRLVRQALERAVPAGWFVDTQDPITLSDSEPEPDAVVTAVDRGTLLDRHPGIGEVGLVVEISDTSLPRDRTTKRRLYAQSAIPVYWVVNLVEDRIEVYSEPSGPADMPDYARQDRYRREEEIPVVLNGREVGRIRAGELLPG
jgi:hypothetical protein